MNYSTAIELLLSLPDLERRSTGPLARSMSLDTMKMLLAELGNPHLNRKTIHITGSKGKGSTSAFIAGFLHAAGYSTALYTSPHLHEYTERISINLQPVTQDVFVNGLEAISTALQKAHASGPISTFGAMTALYFWLCRQLNVDWQIVEVGMGGMFDATNVFTGKEVAVITPISLEHTAALGSTPAEIAHNKAGIITRDAHVVLAKQTDPAVKRVIEDHCKRNNAQLVDVSQIYAIEDGGLLERTETSWSFQKCRVNGRGRELDLEIRMAGQHQQINLTAAIAVLDALKESGYQLPDSCIQEAATHICVPGRVETLLADPLLVVDGAHNGESARVLADSIKRHFRYRRCIMVLGVNSDKNILEILSELAPISDTIIATRSMSEKAMMPQSIANTACDAGIACDVQESVGDALKHSLSVAGREDLICVTGSLYLVGEAREYLGFSSHRSLWQVAPDSVAQQ